MKKEQCCLERVSKLTRVAQQFKCRTEKHIMQHNTSWHVLLVTRHRTSQRRLADHNQTFSPLYKAWKTKQNETTISITVYFLHLQCPFYFWERKSPKKKDMFLLCLLWHVHELPPEISKLLGSEVLHFSWKQSVPLWMPEGTLRPQRDKATLSFSCARDWQPPEWSGGRGKQNYSLSRMKP